MKRFLAILAFLTLITCLHAQTPWYAGAWKGDDGSMVLISKTDHMYGDYEFFICWRSDHGSYYYFSTPKVVNGKVSAELVQDADLCGTLYFSANANSLVWASNGDDVVIYHKDSSIAAQLRETKVRSDTEREVWEKASEMMDTERARIAATVIAKNPWVLGTWVGDRCASVTIKADGKAYFSEGASEIIDAYPDDGFSFTYDFDYVYYIDWAKKTITCDSGDVLRKVR